MNKRRPGLAFMLLLLFLTGAAYAQDGCVQPPTLIESVTVFDGESIRPTAHVLIRCERIGGVFSADALPEVPANAVIIDGRGKTLMPGLFDSHGHTFQRVMLERSLDFGVTTVLDMGSTSQDFVANIKAVGAIRRLSLLVLGLDVGNKVMAGRPHIEDGGDTEIQRSLEHDALKRVSVRVEQARHQCLAPPIDHDGIRRNLWKLIGRKDTADAVSYTHLTLPTITE